MKYFDRTNLYSNKSRISLYYFSCFASTVAEYVLILFVFVLGLSGPHSILDYANFTPETTTVDSRKEVKITIKSPQKLSTSTATTPVQKITTPSPANDFITLAGHSIPIFRSTNTKIDAGSRVGFYGSGFLYGHNATVFGPLGSVQTFSVTLNGATKNYSVVKQITLPKTCESSSECAEKYMGSLTKNQSYRGKTYSLVLMTCAGTPIPPTDATHRLIVFANEI